MTLSEFYNTVPDKSYIRAIHDTNEQVFRSFRKFALEGRSPGRGSFVWACLTNDLSTTVGKADHMLSEHLQDIVLYLNNSLPVGCWGSEEAVKNWTEKGGLEGLFGTEDAVEIALDSNV